MVNVGHRGFSIVEIIIGLQVFTVLALITVPNFVKIRQVYQVRAAAREIYSDLQNARMGAVMEDHRYRFILVDGQTYQLHDDVNSNGAIDNGESVTTRSIATDAPGVTLSSATSPVTFLSDGTVLSSATITATKGNKTINVVVSSGGRVTVVYS